MTPLRSHCSLLVFGYQLVSVSNMVTVPFLSQTVQELFCSPPPFFFFAKEKVLCFDYCSESYIERPDSPAKIISENLYFSFSFSFFLTTYCLFSFLPYAKRQAPLFLFQKQKMQLKSKSVTSLYSFFLFIYFNHLLFWPTSTTTYSNWVQYLYFTQAQYEFGFTLWLLELLLLSGKHLEPCV